jgi:tRNA (guanine-N7-)-methyltransferase
MRADFLEDAFDKNEIGKIYINFCNPWPKERHQKRRLTHTRFLKKYSLFLKKESFLEFKTDDAMLYEDTLNYFEDSGFSIQYKTSDLHASDIKGNIMTEYEKKFSSIGIKIKYACAKKALD